MSDFTEDYVIPAVGMLLVLLLIVGLGWALFHFIDSGDNRAHRNYCRSVKIYADQGDKTMQHKWAEEGCADVTPAPR